MDIFKKKRTLIIGALFIMLLSLFGLTYAFFNANVIGDGKDIVVVGGSLSLYFEDGSEMTIDDAYPGDKIEKIFTVTNTGTLPTSYTMWWKDLTNTFINDELVMSLECTSYKEIDGEKVVNGTCSGLNETVIGNDSSFPIKSNIQIESGIIHEYKLIILFKEMGIIQNYNMNKSFGGTINIKEYFHNETGIPVLVSYDMTNKDLVAKVSDTGYIVEYAITDASVTSADDVTWTTIERTSVLDINQKIEDYDIKIWAKNNAGNIMCEDLTPQISLVVKPNGGTWNGSTGDQTYNFAYSQTLNIPNPTREGYTFNNWTLVGSESKLSGTTFTAGIENTTLTANWTINEYTLTVNPNGGKYNNSTSNTTYTLDYKESQNISIPEREGYTFTGWSISSNKAQLSTNILTIGSENCTLTANWQANNYPWIAYHNKMNVNGSGYTLVDADTKSGEAEYGSKVTPSVNTYTGFTSPSSKEITIVVDTNPPVKNVVNYNYERNKYGLTINANGGTYSGNNPGELYYEQTVIIANPTRTGYNFGGWTKTGGGTLTDTTFKGGLSASTLTASWNAIKSTVSFNLNGGTGSYSNITVEYNGVYGTLPTPTRDNYKFLGWYTLADGGQNITSNTKVTITSSQVLYAQWEIIPTLYNKILADNPTIIDDNADLFENVADEASESGLFRTTDLTKTEDINGDGTGEEVLYFRGAVTNNYVIFAGYCWRIVRTNESGESIKLRYGGEPTTSGDNYVCPQTGTDVKITVNNISTHSFSYNAQYNDSKYVKWVHEDGMDSNAKTQVETWYTNEIETQGEAITKLIIDEPYCNDTSVGSTSGNYTYYGAYTRLDTNKSPQFKCPNASDKYTVDATKGNGKLSKPIGLLTADEVAFAGGVYNTTNLSYYLYTGGNYWTISPYYWSGSYVHEFFVFSSGHLFSNLVLHTFGLLPSVSLSSEAIVADGGTGVYNNPYIIVAN